MHTTYPMTKLAALCLAAVVAAITLSARPSAMAQQPVTVAGDVSPVDSPFVPGDQGIPSNGSTVETDGVNFMGIPVDIFGDPLIDEDGNQVGQFNYERSANIEVGRNAPGQLIMTAGAELRFGDLIIGGDGGLETAPNNLNVDNGDFGVGETGGVGIVEIMGVGTVYNNHPRIIPTQFQTPFMPEVPIFAPIPDTFNPDASLGGINDVGGITDRITNIRREVTDEFDLYVGLTGTGVLNILDGGRAEIHDGAFVGVGPSSSGRINVDGAGSSLSIYGLKRPFSVGDEASGEETVVGLFGEGTIAITGGGRVDSFNRVALGAADGAGEDPANDGAQQGHGVGLVEGAGSVWRIFTPDGGNGDDASALAIGRYADSGAGTQDARIDDLLSNPNAYLAEDGRGTMRIRSGGLVTLLQDNDDGTDNDASLRIGFYGELQLNGGRIVLGGRLDNDGLIRTGDNLNNTESFGDGVIETGTFLNSPIGQVRVRAGEHLQIRSLTEDGAINVGTVTAGATTSNYTYANAGAIEVLGDQAVGKAEIEFVRDLDPSQNNTLADNRFENLQFVDVPDQLGGMVEVRGQIKAQDANLFFRSDFLNEADVLFVGGDNVVTGAVENNITGVISITNESHVTFQDNVLNDGTIVLSDESDVTFGANLSGAGALIDLNPATITVAGDFQTSGVLDFVIGGGPDGNESTVFSVVGDAVFDAGASLAVSAISLSGLEAGDSFKLIDIAGGVVSNGFMNALGVSALPTLPAGSDLFFIPDTDITDGEYILTVGSISASFPFTPTGGDLNGDGIVNFDDVLIWQANNGLQSGGSLPLGDVDGDGDVDPADLAIINDQFGGAPVAVILLASVPEPSTCMLLLAGCIAGLARRRS